MAQHSDSGELPERFTRKLGKTSEEDDELLGEIDDSPRPTPEQRDLAMLMDEIGASPKATVTIYRTTASKGKGAYIMQYPLSSKTLQEVMDYLRDVKKGGEFRFYIHDGSCMRGNQPVSVEPPTPEEVREYEAKVKSANPYPSQNQSTQPAQSDALVTLLASMKEDQARRDEQYREEQKRRDEQAREDRLREEKRQDRELEREREDKKFMLQLLTGNKSEGNSLTELIKGMVAMQALNGGAKKETDPLELIDRVMNIQNKLIDNAPGQQKDESIVNTAIKHLGAPLLTVLAGMNAPPVMQNPTPRQSIRQPKPANPSAPAALPQPETVVTETTAPVPPPTQQEKLAMLLQEIITAAQQDADPTPYAGRLIEELGEDQCAPLVEDSEEGDKAFEMLLMQLGAVGVQFRPWFDKLRGIMLDSLFLPDDESDDDEQSINVSDEAGDQLSG